MLASTAGEEIERRARTVLSLIAGLLPADDLDAACTALPPVLGTWFRERVEPVV